MIQPAKPSKVNVDTEYQRRALTDSLLLRGEREQVHQRVLDQVPADRRQSLELVLHTNDQGLHHCSSHSAEGAEMAYRRGGVAGHSVLHTIYHSQRQGHEPPHWNHTKRKVIKAGKKRKKAKRTFLCGEDGEHDVTQSLQAD